MFLYFKILIFTSAIIWLFPPIRHYKQKYFWFFLVLALTDPFTIVVGRGLGLAFPQLYVLFNGLFFFSLVDYRKITFYKLIFFLVFILSGVFSFVNYWAFSYQYIVLTFSLILFIITKSSVQFVINTGSINIFHIVLVFYLLSNILKFWNLNAQFDTGYALFFVTSSFQILVGIFFSLYKEDDSKLIIKISGEK
ncbi:MAG: hypothetical protein AB1394_00905 [Bacteroidota bacterium]